MKTLCEALAAVGNKVPPGQRLYHVQVESNDFYVVSNSPGQAALSVCQVRLVSAKEALDAVLENLRNQK